MATYLPISGKNLLTGATDVDGDPIEVYGINGSQVMSWPHDFTVGGWLPCRAYQNGTLEYDADAVAANHPADGVTVTVGTFTKAVADDRGGISSYQTDTIELTGEATPGGSGLVTEGLAARWAADTGVSLSGSDVTAWADTVSSRSATAAGAPAIGVAPGGTAGDTMVISTNDGLTFADLTGLPIGSSARTVQMIWKPVAGQTFYGGFGYGANTLYGALTISRNDAGELAIDYGGNARFFTGLHPTDQWCIVTVTFDGTTVKVYVGDHLVGSETVALNTGTVRGNICRSFSNFTTTAEIGEILVYSAELSAAQITQNIDYLNGRFLGDLTLADQTAPTASSVTSASFSLNGNAVGSFGYTAYAIVTSATPLSEAALLAGTGAIQHGVIPHDGSQAYSVPITGASAATGYYAQVIEYDLVGGKSNVVVSSVITTSGGDVTAPVLSSAGATVTGTTTATALVDTDEGNGTLKFGLSLQSATAPSATQLEAGTDGDDAALIGGLRTQAVTGTGTQSANITGMTDATGYRLSYVQRDAANNRSNIVHATFATASAATGDLAPDETASTVAGVQAILASWDGGANTPAGKTSTERRVVQLTAPVGSMTLSGYDFSAITGGVVVRGIGPYADNPTYPYYPTCGSHVAGAITISGCTNLSVYGITCEKLVFNNSSQDCFGERVSVHSRWSGTRSRPSVTGPAVQFDNAQSCGFIKGHAGGFQTVTADIAPGSDDFAVEENYLEQFSDDIIKCRIGTSTVNRGVVRRNFIGRDNLSPQGAHSDYNQNQNGNTPDYLFWGNCFMRGTEINTVDNANMQFLWQSNTNTHDRCIASQNIYAGSTGNGLNHRLGANTYAGYNTLLYGEDGAHGSIQSLGGLGPRITGSWTTVEYNFVCRQSSGSADSSGTGGVVFTVGVSNSNAVVASVSGYSAYFEGFPGEETFIDTLKPKVGTAAHWDFSGQKIGAWERSREIWLEGRHPGNYGWPAAGRFHAEYDPSNTLGSSWTGTYDDDGNNVVPAPTSVTISNAALTLYDCDPHGLGSARITFSGTHNQDGSTLQIRVYDPSDDSDVVAWADFAAGAGGNWSRSVDVPRGFNACRAEVRAKFATSIDAQQSASFYVGYIVGILGQSLAERPLYVASSTSSLTPPAKTLWMIENDQNGSTAAGQKEITASSVLGLRRMACAIAAHSDAPVCIVDLARSGTSFGSLVNADESTSIPERSWFLSFQNPIDYVQARGSDLSVVIWHWLTSNAGVREEAERYLMPGLAKQALDGLGDTGDSSGLTPYTGGAVQVAGSYTPVHFLWDLNGTGFGVFDENRTRFTALYGASYASASGVSGSWNVSDINKGRFTQAQRDMTDGVGIGQFSLANVPGWTGHTSFGGHMAQPEGTHVNDDAGEEDGEALAAVYIGIAACRAVGALSGLEPRITDVTDAGTHWDVEVDLPHGGNLSTALIEHGAGAYAGSFEATNWQTPTAIDETDIPELHEVQGFAVWTGSSASWTGFTAVIQDTGTGTVPNRTGVIRVTPSGGTAGKELSFGYAAWHNMVSIANFNASRVYTHLPIETRSHVSGAGYGYPVRRQPNNTSIVPET